MSRLTFESVAWLCISVCLACSEQAASDSANSGGGGSGGNFGGSGGQPNGGKAGSGAAGGASGSGSGGTYAGSGGGTVNVSGKNVWTKVEVPLTNEQDTPHAAGWSTAVFDSATAELVVYDRYVDAENADFFYSNALWAYDPVKNRWRLRWKSPWHNTGYCSIENINEQYDAPHDRHPYSQMVFDPNSNVLIQYGGPSYNCFGTDDLENIWFFHSDSDTWSHAVAPYEASSLYEANFVLDQNRGRIISNNGLENDNTYRAFDLVEQSWSPLAIPSGLYGNRDMSGMAYADSTHEVLVFGGRTYGQPGQNETFLLDTNTDTWTEVGGTKPPGRDGHGLVYDPKHDIALLYGGYTVDDSALADTWVFDFKTHTWTELVSAEAGPTPPMTTRIAPLTYDPIHDVFLMPAVDPASPYVYANVWMLKYEP